MRLRISRALHLMGTLPALLLAGCGNDLTQPAAESPAQWEIAYPWPPPLPLVAAWSDGRGSVCAVGKSGAVLRLDAHGWRREVLDAAPEFLAVAGETPRDLYAVGFPGSLYRFDGRTWELHTEGVKGNALSARAGKLFATGFGGIVWIWDGDAWSTVTIDLTCTPPPGYNACSPPQLEDIWAAGPEEAFAIAGGSIFHVQGAVADSMLVPVHQPLTAIWGSSATDVYAVGTAGLVLHAQGSGWSVVDLGTQENLLDVSGTGPTDVHVLGSTSAHHFDGIGWARSSLDLASPARALACAGRAQAYIVGDRGVLYEFDGAGWSPLPGASPPELQGLCVLQDGNAIAVGDSGLAVHETPAGFSIVDTGAGVQLWAVASDDGNRVFAVGDAGTVARFDGTAWTRETPVTDASLYGVWAATGGGVFAVGSSGTIVHFDGTSWNTMTSGTDRALFAVHGTSTNHVVAVGDQGTALRYDGAAWLPILSDSPQPFVDVWVRPDGSFWALRPDGVVSKWDGTGWADLRIELDGALTGSLCEVDDGALYVTAWRLMGWGYTSTLHRYDGTGWTTERTGIPTLLCRVRGRTAGQLHALAQGGMILHRSAADGR